MIDYEKLGTFYLGRQLDHATRKPTGDLVLYDSKDLVTHALCVGMTGSGKTGLGISVIEEAAIDGVPVLVIDPKGDLTNLMLTFPDLAPADFAPWVSEDEARRAGKSPDEFAADQAALWKKGLAEWGEDGDRIKRLRDAAEFTLYTPGSTAGRPVSVLTSFNRPPTDDPESLRERIQTTVSSLLGLAGVEADPLKGREHILLSNLLQLAWQAGESPTLATLVQRIQQPPMARIGVIDVESFFPSKDRFELAMSINALLASPGFEIWSQGDPLDVGALLRTSSGKPRVSIFTIAHLDDSQRMFFVSLLLNAVAGWMRSQTGTSSLRALVYMDEIFGFFPPVANPPSKLPLLTLLKQGRAAGLGVVLSTQNPVDLDYKGLSNIGTWWLGRLQTERDKARVLDGLVSAGDAAIDRGKLDEMLSALTARVFLMRNVHEDDLTLFQTRWTLSYLRGPLGRDEIKRIAAASPTAAPAGASGSAKAPATSSPASMSSGDAVSGATAALDAPPMSPDVPQYFSPEAFSAKDSILKAVVYAAANVRFVDPKSKLDVTKLVTLSAPIAESGAVLVDWDNATAVDWSPEMLDAHGPERAHYAPLPAGALTAKNLAAWGKQFLVRVSSGEAIELLRSDVTGELSRPDEGERDFRERLQLSSRESRDRQLEALRKKYAPRIAALDERLRRAQQAVDRESEQASGQKLQTAISVGATLVGALFGRKMISVGNVGRATTAARGMGRAMKESEDVNRARETVDAIGGQRKQLEADLASETAALDAANDVLRETFEKISIKPKKTNVAPKLVAIVWTT